MNVTTIGELLNRAIALHQIGRFAQAEPLYKEALRVQPKHFGALNLLGILSAQMEKYEEAARLLRRALKIDAQSESTLYNYGNVLKSLNRCTEALQCFDKALALNAAAPETWNSRGSVLNDLKRFEESVSSLARALALKPSFPEAFYNRGNALYGLRRFGDAVSSYDQALAIQPRLAEVWSSRGNALLELKHYIDALNSYDKAIALKSALAAAWLGRGNVLTKMMQYNDAGAAYDSALALKSSFAEAWVGRGNIFAELRQYKDALAAYDRATHLPEAWVGRGNIFANTRQHEDALAAYKRALTLKPDYPEALFNLGRLFEQQNRVEDALRCYEQALAAQPDMASARLALCVAELPILYVDAAEMPVRRAAYEKRLRQLRDDLDRGKVAGDLAEAIGSKQPFYLAYQGDDDRELQSIYGSMVCELVANRYPVAARTVSSGFGERRKVGFVSGYFNNHTVWKLMRGWVSQLDRGRFEVTGYYTGVISDEATEQAAQLCDRFVQGPMSIDNWRSVMLSDAPDALIYPEIGMDPISVRLAAQRLAKVQCNFWGHPETSGFPTLDYFLSSALMEPPDGESHYSEKLIRLPNLSIYYEPPEIAPVTISRTELRLRTRSVAYWCGQSLFKYLPQFDQVFPRIAREAGDCQFFFIEHAGAKQITDLFLTRLEAEFSAYGLRAADYCVILPRLDIRQFIGAIGQCDIVLDSIGWSGGNTTLESLYHSPPIVTLPGKMMRGRHTAAILQMMGVTETIAATMDDYVAIAARLARDTDWRAVIRERMANRKECVYRDNIPVRALEEFLDSAIRSTTMTAD